MIEQPVWMMKCRVPIGSIAGGYEPASDECDVAWDREIHHVSWQRATGACRERPVG
jgi:hypothetical protein